MGLNDQTKPPQQTFLKKLSASAARTIGVIVGIIAVTTAINLISSSTEFNLESEMREVAEEFNSQLPMMIDRDTRLDSTIALGKSFAFRYTLVNLTVDEVDLNALENEVYPMIKRTVCTSPEMDFFREHDLVMEYRIYDKNGAYVSVYKIPTTSCD